jgi:hypothetical protein
MALKITSGKNPDNIRKIPSMVKNGLCLILI